MQIHALNVLIVLQVMPLRIGHLVEYDADGSDVVKQIPVLKQEKVFSHIFASVAVNLEERKKIKVLDLILYVL